MQLSQPVLAGFGWLPAGQRVHTGSSEARYVPGSHGMQPVRSAELVLPAAQNGSELGLVRMHHGPVDWTSSSSSSHHGYGSSDAQKSAPASLIEPQNSGLLIPIASGMSHSPAGQSSSTSSRSCNRSAAVTKSTSTPSMSTSRPNGGESAEVVTTSQTS